MASFSISWLHGFQVLQVSSPHRHQLGLGGAKGFRCVGGQLDCQIGRKLRGPRWVVWCRFSIGFRKIRFGLGSVDECQTSVGIISQYEADFIRFIDGQTISSRNFHISHSSFKAFKMLLVVLLLDSSKVCPAPTRLRWATILPQQLLASLGALHVQAMDSACIGFTTLHHRPLVQMKRQSKLQSIPENRLHSIQLKKDTSRRIERPCRLLTRIDGQQTTDQTQWIYIVHVHHVFICCIECLCVGRPPINSWVGG